LLACWLFFKLGLCNFLFTDKPTEAFLSRLQSSIHSLKLISSLFLNLQKWNRILQIFKSGLKPFFETCLQTCKNKLECSGRIKKATSSQYKTRLKSRFKEWFEVEFEIRKFNFVFCKFKNKLEIKLQRMNQALQFW